ncbi:MAG: OmpH family outer membrane protein [Bacteroidia bacterium]|nr:OmpH family outer membrane protein [Bacteroidia bacterium]
MKKLSVILFSVIFLAIALLYFFYFTGIAKGKKSDKKPEQSEVAAAGIAYVNVDSLITKFDMFFDRRDELMEKQNKAEAELNSKAGQYEKNARDYQEKVTKGLVTRATAAEMEQALMQQQQELMNLRDNLQSNLLEEEQVMNRQILEYITSFLEESKSEYNYQYILGKSFGGQVLYGDSALDITQKVLDAINAKYQAENKK